jgi:hypothetical protein
MPSENCTTCHKPKANHSCGICRSPICKGCSQFVEEKSFAFLEKTPEELTHTVYCGICFDEKVAGPLRDYKETMRRAKNVFVFFKAQSKESRLMSRNADAVEVPDCADREETILRLGFLAAKAGYNALVDVDIVHEKIRIGAYQTTKWSGKGIPTQVDATKMNRR